MKRRDLVQSLLTPETPAPAAPGPARVPSGAVRAMGLELTRLDERAREAEAVRRQLEDGTVVVALDPAVVEPSFVSDRLSRTGDAEYRRLVDSIRESGQQVPILVRPSLQRAGFYQIAYGHRRREAALELGIEVRAIVRTLSDAELVVAQGKENAERQDLSFIERALFAASLEKRGFDRATANAALGVHTAEMTRLLTVAAAVPLEIIEAIGPAPKAGRPRWMAMARLLDTAEQMAQARDLVTQMSFRKLSSDQRFGAMLEALKSYQPGDEPQVFCGRQGEVLARADKVGKVLRLSIDEQAAPGLAAMLIAALPELLRKYEAAQARKPRRGRYV